MGTFRTSVSIAGLVAVCVSTLIGATPSIASADSWSPTINTNQIIGPAQNVVGPAQNVGPSGWSGQPPTVTSSGSGATAPSSSFAPSFGGHSAPRIVQDPANETVAAGATASFSASASGSPTPTVQWESSTNGTSWSSITGATSSTYSFSATSSENGERFEAVFTNRYGSATTTAATLTVSSSTSPTAPSTVQSSNWSGYADTGTTFTSVSGSWTVPTVSCTGGTAYSAQWIGIDGYSSSTVEQDGTSADCSGRSASYNAWYEMYGDSKVDGGDEVELSPSAYPVAAGDSISATVSVTSNVWSLEISDASSGHPWTYTTTISYSGAAASSAEWIVERPEVCSYSCSLTTLANFGTVTFANASTSSTTSSGTIATYSPTAIQMVNGSTVIAQPGALSSGGAGFTDTYQ